MKRLKASDDRPVFMDEPEVQETAPPTMTIGKTVARADYPAFGAVPEVGVYANVPFSVYFSWRALNHSTLRKMDDSAEHYRYAMDNPSDDETPSKAFGTAGHEMFLESERFAARVVPAPINPKTQKAYGRDTIAWSEYASQYAGKMILTADEMDRLRAMIDKLRVHPSIEPLMSEPGFSEVCIVWDDAITGLRCKARIDRLIPTWGRLDLKTTRKAKHTEFRRSLLQYGYFTQDAFYGMGVKALQDAKLLACKDRSVFVAIESEPPHGIGVYEVGADSLGLAHNIVREWLCSVESCMKRGVWPGYSEQVQAIDVPEYFFKQFQNDE